ncbi:MAG: beta-propeller fold lactonase family protein [Bryobacteraceae bacterium]
MNGTPSAVAITPNGEYIYTASGGDNKVSVFSTASRQLVAAVAVGSKPVQIVLSADGTRGYAVNQDSNTVSIIDTADNTITGHVRVGIRPAALAIAPDQQKIVVTNLSSDFVSVIDPVRQKVTQMWPARPGMSGIALSPNGRMAYLTNAKDGTLTSYDVGSGSIVQTISGLGSPGAISVTRDGSRIYVADRVGNSVSIIDVYTGAVIAAPEVGSRPGSVTMSADGTEAYVTSAQDGSVSVISTASSAVSRTIPLAGSAPASLAVANVTRASLVLPKLPQATVNTTFPIVTGHSIPVHAGSDFQAALNSANCGDELVLDAGAVYSGNFVVPTRNCTSKILIRSSALSSLPAGKRVSPSSVAYMATLVTPNKNPVLNFSQSATGFYFAGLQLTVNNGVQGLWNLVLLSANTTQTSQLPANIIFDRVYAHGNDQYCVRGFLADGVGFGLINSYVSGFIHTSYDTQAVMAYNSPGPFLISNNYLEATGENIMLGGGNACSLSGSTWACTPRIAGVIPSDATITRNWFNKLYVAWYGKPTSGAKYDVKNHFEIKNGQRVLLDSNVFTYMWQQGQGSNSIVLTPRTGCASSGVIGSGTQPGPMNCPDPQATASDITITNNQFLHVGGTVYGFGVDNYGYPYVTTQSARVLVQNNLAQDISAAYNGGGFISFGNTQNWTVNHNTSINNPYYPCGWSSSECSVAGLFFGDVYPPSCPSFSTPGCTWVYGPTGNPGVTITNNIIYGSLGANSDNALMVVEQLPPSANVSYDVWVGDYTTGYPASAHFFTPVSSTKPVSGAPACNQPYAPAACFAINEALVGFQNFTGGSYQLSTSSPYHNAGNDGTDIGANVPAVLAATAGVSN